MFGEDGGLCDIALLGARNLDLWARGPDDASGLCEALCQAEQERRGGCRGDLRGGDTALHAPGVSFRSFSSSDYPTKR